MKRPATRIIAAVVSVVVTFTLLLGGYSLYQRHIVQKPLVQALNAIEGVQDVQMVKAEGEYRIKVVLDDVDNLQSVYVKLDETTADYLTRQSYQLQINDQRNGQLINMYNQLQPYIYEALAKDNYIWLQDEISQQIASNSPDTDFKFFIDGDRIYLQMTRDNKSLYAVIPRQLTEEAVQI